MTGPGSNDKRQLGHMNAVGAAQSIMSPNARWPRLALKSRAVSNCYARVTPSQEVAKHNHKDDAWIIIQNADSKEWLVYDVTEYQDDHPGGEVIIRNAGGNATEGFHGPHHPSTTFVIVKDFCIGKLADGEVPK